LRIASNPPGYADCPVETGASSASSAIEFDLQLLPLSRDESNLFDQCPKDLGSLYAGFLRIESTG
jgi:hypothetical protein